VQKILDQTKKSLLAIKEDHRQAQFAIKEREYIICRHKKSGM
jgi:hypothetical protein